MQIIVQLDGMRTVHCVRAVFQALAGVPGIVRADVAMGSAVLLTDGPVDHDVLVGALAALGYRVRGRTDSTRALPVADDPSATA